ncbi:MAG: sensor histidine kinase [Vicinamibacterales bacterium]
MATAEAASPAKGLVLGMVITLLAVGADSYYVTRQIGRLRVLQTGLADRSRKDSLQLLRVQSDLNSLGLAMRDMLDTDGGAGYPLAAWATPLNRIRRDLADALRLEEQFASGTRTPEQRQYLADSLAQFWDASDRIFALARDGHESEARDQIRLSLQARQAALGTAVARLLVENNASEAETAARVEGIYTEVERQVYIFLAATLAAIVITSLYLIRSNRRLFARLASLSDERRDVAQQLITARESTLRHIARELHDEFGQTLTAMGSMLSRAERHAAAAPLKNELREIAEIAQRLLEQIRGLSQALHPSILEAVGLEGTVDSYLSTVERQTGVHVVYERTGVVLPVDVTIATHVYRIMQEALTNVARHASVTKAWVRLGTAAGMLELEVEDHGSGLPATTARRGLGLVTMRERVALVGGTIEFTRPREGGTLVRVRVPLAPAQNGERRAG